MARGRGGCHLPYGDRPRVRARRDAPDHHVAADRPLDLAVFPADCQRSDPEVAHQVTCPAQRLSRVYVPNIRFRGLARAGHRDPLLSLSKPTAPPPPPGISMVASDQRSRPKSRPYPYKYVNAEPPERVHHATAKWLPLHPCMEEIRPLSTHARISPGGTDPERTLRRPRAPPAREGGVPRPVSPPELLPRDCASARMCSRIRRVHGVCVVFVLRGHRPGADSSSAGPGAGPAKPVCRSCGRAQRLVPLVPLVLRCQARARRAASIAALSTTVIPSASSRPSHGWSSKARPPSRPMRNA